METQVRRPYPGRVQHAPIVRWGASQTVELTLRRMQHKVIGSADTDRSWSQLRPGRFEDRPAVREATSGSQERKRQESHKEKRLKDTTSP